MIAGSSVTVAINISDVPSGRMMLVNFTDVWSRIPSMITILPD